MAREVFAGVDIETTGSDIDKGHGLIQIGMRSEDGFEFVMDVNPLPCVIEDEAMNIHRIPLDRIERAPLPATVDEAMFTALTDHYAGERFRLIAVGWNVGSFDMPFVKKYLPRTFSLFSYRSVDLNSPLFTLDAARKGIKGVMRYDGLKKRAKQFAEEVLAAKGFPAAWHDALYDAKAGLLSWKYLQTKMMVVD